MEPARKLATYEDLVELPGDRKAEIIAGSIVALPAALPRHSRVQGGLSVLIGGPFDRDDGRGGPGGWWIMLEVDVRLARNDIVRPDLSGWRREQLVDPWDAQPIDVVPDWACEITSPSNERHDHVTKSRMYAAAGVTYYWLINPLERVLEAQVLEGDKWKILHRCADGDIARIEPFEAIELEVGRLLAPEAAR
jgi:Uma2 family endonuclease